MPQRASESEHDPATATATAVCPFCALLCDDLRLAQASDQTFAITRNGCRRAAQDFARPPLAPAAEIAGRAVSLEAAIAAAARLIKRARHPLIAGLATDVDGIRAAVNLAERCDGTLDHVHGETLSAMARVLQTRGWYTTTLSEVRNRADLVLMIGLDLDQRHENFVRRCLRPADSLTPTHLAARRAYYLGATPPGERAGIELLRCRNEQFAAALQGLLAVLKGEFLTARTLGGIKRTTLAELARNLRAARYSALVFAPAAFGEQREPALAALFEVVEELNRTTRAAALPLGGDDGGQTAQSTCAWLTGYPLRIHCGRTVSYDPVAHATAPLLASGATDLVLWIDAFGRQGTPPAASTPAHTIVLGATRPAQSAAPAVFIAVGTPGVDHAARLVRTDNVVSLALAAQRDTALPAVATVLADITARL